MSSPQSFAILCNIFAALLGAGGQWAYKKGAARLTDTPLYANWMLLLGILLFCGVMVLFVMGYKNGGRISVVYPFYATTFAWGALIGFVVEKEPFQWSLIGGTLLVLAGLIVIASGVNQS